MAIAKPKKAVDLARKEAPPARPKPTLKGQEIRTDSEGRMLLTDIRKALEDDGGKMYDWLKCERTKALIAVLTDDFRKEPVNTVIKGTAATPRGTYVSKTLAYDFIMCVSPGLQILMTAECDAHRPMFTGE